MSELNKNSARKKWEVPRGKHHNKTATKTTVNLYLSKKVVEKARKNRLNISRITEQGLNSILDYREAQNRTEISKFLSECSFPKENSVPRWLSLVEQRFRKPSVAGSKPARGFKSKMQCKRTCWMV